MNIAVTKTFTKFINKTAKELNFRASASFVTMTEGYYHMLVADPVEAILYCGGHDYDYRTGQFKAIRIDYPSEYYACPRYLTTYELTEEFNRRGVETDRELKEMLKDLIEI